MSSYIKKLKNPKTDKLQEALCLDDFYGNHRYGYAFRKDGSNADYWDSYDLEDYDIFNEDEINL